jgi:transducin (beta)-like 1
MSHHPTMNRNWYHENLLQEKQKLWSWFAGFDMPGVFELDWQKSGKHNRIAMALECRLACVADVEQIPALQNRS